MIEDMVVDGLFPYFAIVSDKLMIAYVHTVVLNLSEFQSDSTLALFCFKECSGFCCRLSKT